MKSWISLRSSRLANDQLEVGEKLNLPQSLPTTNNAANMVPYGRLMDSIIGSLYLYLPLKQPPKPKHSFWGDLVHTVVDTVAAIVGMILGAPLGPVGSAIMSGLFTAVADAEYQAVAVELGWQDHFSLRSAVTAGEVAAIDTAIFEGVTGGIPGLSERNRSEVDAWMSESEIRGVPGFRCAHLGFVTYAITSESPAMNEWTKGV